MVGLQNLSVQLTFTGRVDIKLAEKTYQNKRKGFNTVFSIGCHPSQTKIILFKATALYSVRIIIIIPFGIIKR